jgi:hypothetical protein
MRSGSERMALALASASGQGAGTETEGQYNACNRIKLNFSVSRSLAIVLRERGHAL